MGEVAFKKMAEHRGFRHRLLKRGRAGFEAGRRGRKKVENGYTWGDDGRERKNGRRGERTGYRERAVKDTKERENE